MASRAEGDDWALGTVFGPQCSAIALRSILRVLTLAASLDHTTNTTTTTQALQMRRLSVSAYAPSKHGFSG